MGNIYRPSATSQLVLAQTKSLDFIPDEKHPMWVKWTYASMHKHFDAFKGQYTMYIEGDERTMQDEGEFMELRVDGPFITQLQKGYYYLDIEVNVLVQTHVDATDLYKIHKIVGQILPSFSHAICVYKYGDTELDDDSLAGSYRLMKDLRETVDINHYGLIRDDTRMLQTTLEGHYRWEVTYF